MYLEFRANFSQVFRFLFSSLNLNQNVLILDYSGPIVDLGRGNLKNKQKCKNFLSENSIFLVGKADRLISKVTYKKLRPLTSENIFRYNIFSVKGSVRNKNSLFKKVYPSKNQL